MEYVSAWWAPIPVTLGRAAAVTYGLVATELVEHLGTGDEFTQRLINRFGIDNLRDAARSLSDPPPSNEPVPDSVLAHRLAEEVSNHFAPFVRPILAAADASWKLDVDVSDGIRRLIDTKGPTGVHPVRLSRNAKTVWGHRCDTVLQRSALEVFELSATGARLRRCIYCGSVYVPRRDERHCQWNVWPAARNAGSAPLRLCSSERHAAIRRANADRSPLEVHTRERKRLYAKEARARAAALGRGENPETVLAVVKARQARLQFIDDSQFRRGRKADTLEQPDVREAE